MPGIAFAEGTEPDASVSPSASPSPSPSPSPTPVPIVDQLHIDSTNLYDGMDKTYAQGYVPTVQNGYATIILPLMGETYSGTVNVTADLGAVTESPFVFGNYSQTANGNGLYIFRFDIPLVGGRINGSYPVVLTAEYLDVTGVKASQPFTVYVTIEDGKAPIDPNAKPDKETIDKPELFISSCAIDPDSVGGDEEFTVDVTVKNIGTLRARSVRLTYSGMAAGGESGGSAPSIIPVESNNSVYLGNIAAEESGSASFKLKTTKDVLAGNQPFFITLDYIDLYGGVYTATRQFLVRVTQPAEISYDPIAPPKEITAGETLSLPANVFNIGKSTLRNVTITVAGAGLFPVSSVFLGDILPGQAGNGEMKVFIGMLSMTEGYTENYGKTNGKYTIIYSDDAGEQHTIDSEFELEILKPIVEGENEKELTVTAEPAFQWWVAILIGFAIIAVIVATILVAKFSRMMRMK